jgi:hypothetical protein
MIPDDFHQRFMRAFFIQNVSPKNYKAVFWVWKFLVPKYQQKMCAQNVE